ncbi:MAG: L-threonine kinase [Clostridia bacterium]|nr:L-threonine kinase [Clostridia bacterium]
MRATARVPCSCGELVQGIIDGSYCLITCPINVWAKVTVELKPGGGIYGPLGRSKALRAVRLALNLLGERAGAKVWVENPLPPGKGLATSTADVVAAAAATAAAAGYRLTYVELARIALQIEPSDGTFLPGIALFDHIHGKKQEYLGPAPELEILIVDLGGKVDTVNFNRRQDLIKLNRAKEPLVQQAGQLVRLGLAEQNAALVARGATLSALANQVILPKPELESILDLALEGGALGVNAAHSGTVLGILYRPGEIDSRELQIKLKKRHPHLNFFKASLASGGVEVAAEAWSTEALSAAVGK